MPKVALYARISSDPTGEGVKVADQLAECRRWCEQRGWSVVAEYTDNDVSAVSGRRRPGFEDLLTSVQVKQADTVVCWHTDRLVRRMKDLERVIDLGVNVHGVHAGHLDLSTPAGRAVARTVTAWATYEGEQKAERFAMATARRLRAGESWWPSAPMGYNRDKTPSEQADLVRQAYQDVIDGHTLGSISRRWNDAGITTPKGAPWYPASVGQLLRSPRNAGLLEHKGEVVGEAAWEGLVSRDTWETAQAVLRDPSRASGGPRRRTYDLAGLALCGTCAERGEENVVWSGSVKRGLRHYRCSKYSHNQRKAQEAEDWVIGSALARLTAPGATALVEVQETEARPDLLKERTRLESKVLELEAAYEADDLTLAQWKRMTASIKEQLDAVREQLVELDKAHVFAPFVWQSDVIYLDDLAGARAVWDSLPLTRRQAILRAVFDRIVLLPSRQARAFAPWSIELTGHGQATPDEWVDVRA